MVVLQHIVTVWTKRDRGAEGRERRARLPTSYPLPDALLASTRRSVLHTIHRTSAKAPTVREEEQERLRVSEALTLTESEGLLVVAFHGDSGPCGRPRRRDARLSLPSGQRLLVRFNGRYQAYDDPWYEDHIVHVAFDARPSTNLFATPPDVVLDRRVDLW
ncbi:MAG: hypothetical protein IPJ34_20375 [Myxococcales bacterium]|nr:hypothetical protein [Myxococcales bacterium]